MKPFFMKCTLGVAGLLALSLLTARPWAALADSDSVQLKGPIAPQGTAAPPVPVSQPGVNGAVDYTAPGADAMMTPDMLLVTPTVSKEHVNQPLKDLIGTGLKIQIEKTDIKFDTLQGIKISVSNETDRPLVIDGEKAQVLVGGKTYTCAPVSAIQQAVLPTPKKGKEFEEFLKAVVPAAITVGAVPTIRDIKDSRRPVLERYGPDEVRRKLEYSRFGRRILWTQQKVEGILYFQAGEPLATGQLLLPATTLFDTADTAMVTVGPQITR